MEERLAGGNAGGAVLVDGTVRRPTGPWTPAVHALLRHLEARGFDRAPRVLGVDEQGREILTYLVGETVGATKPWPAWVHSDEALEQVGAWLRDYHETVADFVPPTDARWRIGSHVWQRGDVVGHDDAAPYNAVWQESGAGRAQLVGFFDWDFAAPCAPVWDLAFTAWSWVPLHSRAVVGPEGFADFDGRPRRLRLLLDAYGWKGSIVEVLDAVEARITAHVEDVQELVARGDPLFARLAESGVLESLDEALRRLRDDRLSGFYGDH